MGGWVWGDVVVVVVVVGGDVVGVGGGGGGKGGGGGERRGGEGRLGAWWVGREEGGREGGRGGRDKASGFGAWVEGEGIPFLNFGDLGWFRIVFIGWGAGAADSIFCSCS